MDSRKKILRRSAEVFLLAAALLFLPDAAFAVEGDAIFGSAAKAILQNILPGSFGALCVVVAGIVALVSSAVGSYRAAWAVLFVTFACFLANDLVGRFFSL